MTDVTPEQRPLPRDAVLLAGLAFSVLGLTCVFTIGGNLLRHWTTVSTAQLILWVGLPSVVIGYGFAGGSRRRRVVVAVTLLGAWAAFFSQGSLRLLGAAGLLAVISLLVVDGVREARLGIGAHFVCSGALMVLTVGGAGAYGHFQKPVPLAGVWNLWGWVGIVLAVGGLALWVIGLSYDSTHTGTDFGTV